MKLHRNGPEEVVMIDEVGNFHYHLENEIFVGIHWFLNGFVAVTDIIKGGISSYDGSKLYMENV